MRTVNRATNGVPSSIAGWSTTSSYVRTFETVLGRPAIVVTRSATGPGSYLWYGRNTGTLGPSTGTPTSPTGLVPVTPGEVINVFVDLGTNSTNAKAGVLVRAFTAAGAEIIGTSKSSATVDISANRWDTFAVRDYLVPAGAAFIYVEHWIQLRTGNSVGGERSWSSHVYIGTGDGWFNPDTADGGGIAYGWDGAPGLSTSYRVDTLDLIHPWTWAWWESLPHAYRDADAVQNPGVGYYPLLRWMDGIGQIAGQMRDLSDSLWAGDLTNVSKAPDAAVRWLAQMLGVDEKQRARPTADLRNYLADLTVGGRPAVGTRSSIAEVARRYLTGDKQVGVVPSATTPFTIVLLVRATEVPNGGDLAAFAATIKAAGVVPAGHNLIAVNAVPTWDQWQAAAGLTWDELEARVRTWNESDALGVTIA